MTFKPAVPNKNRQLILNYNGPSVADPANVISIWEIRNGQKKVEGVLGDYVSWADNWKTRLIKWLVTVLLPMDVTDPLNWDTCTRH